VSATKRIARNFFWLLSGNTLNGFIALLFTIYIARVLGASAFGLYNFAQAFLVYLVLAVDSGLSILGTREISREKDNAVNISANILALRFLIGLGIYAACLISLLFLPLSVEMKALFGFTFLFVLHRALNGDWIFQGLERMEYIPLAKILVTLSTFCLIVIFVKSPADLVRVPLVNALCGLIVSAGFIWFLFSRLFNRLNWKLTANKWTEYFWQAIPLGASMIMIQIYVNLDTIMLGFMDKASVVGYYNAAYKIHFILIGLFAAWQSTALPAMNKKMKDGIDSAIIFINKYVRLTLLAFIPLYLAVFLLAPLIVQIIFGAEYAASAPALQILIWTFIPTLIGSAYSVTWLIPAGKFNEFFWAAGAGAIANIILNFILIPRYSMYGAAAATIMAETLAMLMVAYFAQKISRLNLFRFILLPLILSSFSLIPYYLISMITGQFLPIIKLGLSGGAFLAAYSLLVLIVERKFIFQFAREIISREQ